MCYPLPYPRCSNHTRIALQKAQAEFDKVVASGIDEKSIEYATAKTNLSVAKSAYRTTPEAIEAMEKELENEDLDDKQKKDLARTILRSKLKRQAQMNALHEYESGRLEAMSVLIAADSSRFDKEEMKNILENHTQVVAASKFANKNADFSPISQEEHDAYIASLEEKGNLSEEEQNAIATLKASKPFDRNTYEAYQKADEAIEKAEVAVTLEQTRIGGLHNVDAITARNYYEAYRKQYKEEYANLPADERPDPPRNWLKNDMKNLAPMGQKEYKYLPGDSASNYAAFRLRADENSIPAEKKQPRVYASIDLETAGPEGSAGFKPENGHIIEVGIVKYNEQGKEIGRYSQLMKPDDAFLAEHGTGAEHIHHISKEDLNGQPSWNEVSNQVGKELDNTVLVAQNAYFEQGWLNHHLPNFKHQTGVGSVVDTLDIGRRHFDLPNYRLETICNMVGVPYTNGHRATHDAEVAGEALFKMKSTLQKQWNSKAARRNAKSISI